MVTIFKSNGTVKWSMYVLYWTGYVLLFSLIQGIPSNDFLTAFYNELFGLVPKVFFVAIVIEWLMNELLFKKRTTFFIISYFMLVLLFAIILRIIDNYIILQYFLTNWTKEALFSSPPFLYSVIKLQFVVTIPFSVKLFNFWAVENTRVHVIQSEKMKAELDSLRNQFHPHFLFNVLNSLYSKILSKSDESADIVLRISSILRFSVYEVNNKAISLENEINYLTNYIELQKIRFDSQLELSFSVTGIIENKFIEPFLIQPFIENSFKYCMNNVFRSGWITIFISANEDWLTIKVENSLPNNNDQSHKLATLTENNRVGLSSVKKRLAILYPDRHVLKIIEGEDSFFVSLKIRLDATG